MSNPRAISRILKARVVIEGAGVHQWHPHRGMETITYVLRGEVDHADDSLGNAGAIGPGDVQWMSAGSGIIHQEMPKGEPGDAMYELQLWANLPAANKMSEPRQPSRSSAPRRPATPAG